MGQMRFIAPQPEHLPPAALERAYLAGIEAIPWFSRHKMVDNVVVVDREVDESGSFFIPWHVEGRGELMLSTTSLMERDEPYHLTVELARGTVNRLRNQLATWQAIGLEVSPQLTESVRNATTAFARSATCQNDVAAADAQAQKSILLALEAIDLLCEAYTHQVLSMRHTQAPRLATLLGGALPAEPLSGEVQREFLETFNAAVPPTSWRDIEPSDGEFEWQALDDCIAWCHQHQLRVCSGPLLRLDKLNTPDWLYLWEEDFENLMSSVRQYVTAVVERFQGRVHVWQCAAGMNVPGAMKLSEEQMLRLTVVAIDSVRRVEPRAPVIVTVERPWAEFMASQPLDLSPVHFADSLVRADLGMAGIGLEINLGYWPGGTLRRDPLELSRLIDHWSMLSLPLLVMLTAPSGSGRDPLAKAGAGVQPCGSDGVSPAHQQTTVEQMLPMLMAKQSVHAVFWNQLCDNQPHGFAHGGLFDADGAAKPALLNLKAFRKEHLN